MNIPVRETPLVTLHAVIAGLFLLFLASSSYDRYTLSTWRYIIDVESLCVLATTGFNIHLGTWSSRDASSISIATISLVMVYLFTDTSYNSRGYFFYSVGFIIRYGYFQLCLFLITSNSLQGQEKGTASTRSGAWRN